MVLFEVFQQAMKVRQLMPAAMIALAEILFKPGETIPVV